MPRFTFDMLLAASITVEADDPETARGWLIAKLDAAETNFGAFDDGRPILGEVSLAQDAPTLAMIDDEDVPAERAILDWNGPEEGDTCDLSVWITNGEGDELLEVDSGDVERNKEIAREVVAKVNAMPWPLEPGIVAKLVAEAIVVTA